MHEVTRASKKTPIEAQREMGFGLVWVKRQEKEARVASPERKSIVLLGADN